MCAQPLNCRTFAQALLHIFAFQHVEETRVVLGCLNCVGVYFTSD